MKLSEIMSEKSIVLGLKSNSKRQLLQDLAAKAAEITGLNERTIFDAIMERENLGSTGFGEGTALPHGRFEGLEKVYGFFAKLNSPVDFEAIDVAGEVGHVIMDMHSDALCGCGNYGNAKFCGSCK